RHCKSSGLFPALARRPRHVCPERRRTSSRQNGKGSRKGPSGETENTHKGGSAMQHTGRVVAVTLTREVSPGVSRTEVVSEQRIPTGLFFALSAIAVHKQEQEQFQMRCIYHRPCRQCRRVH